MRRYPNIAFSWEEGRFLDFWLVVHFLAGVPFGFLALYLNLGPWAYGAATLIFCAWEVFEWAAKIPESAENRVVDVLAAIAGFALAYEFFVGQPNPGQLFIITGAAALALDVAGWLSRARGRSR